MTVRTSAGTTIGISAAAPATFNAAGYGALTYTLIGEITDLGEYGREYSLATHNPVASRGTVKKKGSFNEGAMTLAMGLDEDDAGQTLLQTAVDDDDNYSFEITYPNGAVDYFQAVVMSFKKAVGGVDTITNATTTLELTTNAAGVGVVQVPAA